ncbi:MAG TPA: hypothetical protein VK654_15875 [Nitrospirota bacterium]|nr:hypothetical protein [Nitrospirota bacterium]
MRKLYLISILVLSFAGQAAAENETTATYEFGTARVTIVEKAFDPLQAKVETCQGGAGICRINGAIAFGVASGMPKTFLAKVVVDISGRTYQLDASGMYNAWGRKTGDAAQSLSAHCFDPFNCIVRGLFSEAAGAYVAEWAIVDGRTARTMLTGSRDVVDLFRKNIGAPLFE